MLSLKDYNEVYNVNSPMKWKVFTSLNLYEDRLYTYGPQGSWSEVMTTEAYVPINKLPFIASNYYVLTYELDVQAIIEKQLQEEN